MLITDEWLPPMMVLADYDGDWHRYVDALYQRYLDDLGRKQLLFLGRPVALRFHPHNDGKGYGFWHCIEEGPVEADRAVTMERCKRIPWIKAIIENWNSHGVDYWQEARGSRT